MKFTIPRGETKVAYRDRDFWKQFDEVEVEEPEGWVLRYMEGGIVHYFGYSQSSGHDEYMSEYREEERKIPLAFSADAKANAEVMHGISCNNVNAMLIREV